MSIPIAPTGSVGVIPSANPSAGFTGSPESRETENASAVRTVQSADASGAGSATGQTGYNATNSGQSEIGDSTVRTGVIAPDVSVGPSPAFVTSVLEAANSEAFEPASAEPEAATETATQARESRTRESEAVVDVKSGEPVVTSVPVAPAPDDSVAKAQTQPLESPVEETFNLVRSFSEAGQKPTVDAAA